MQTHVNNIHLRKTTTRRRGIISRRGSERIAEEEEEEEEIEKNMKEFSSAKSATFFSSAFSRQTRLSRTQSKEDYKSFRAVSEGLCFSETEPLRSNCGVFCLAMRHKKIRNEKI